MVDSTEAMQSEFVSVDLVSQSPTKKCVVVDPGNYEESDYGRRLTVKVNLDGMVKRWRPNKESVANLQPYGKDTLDWVGKKVLFEIGLRSGKQAVIGKPDQLPPQTTTETVADPEPQQVPAEAKG